MSAEASLMLGILFGSVGFGYVVFGRRQGRPVAFAVGLAMIAAPYLIPHVGLLLLAGAVLALGPYWLRD